MDTRELAVDLARRDGGVVARRYLLANGVEARTIDDLRRAGALTVIRRGWYRIAEARPAVVAAVKSGGAVTCVSALALRSGEIWIPPGSTASTHLRWPEHLHRRRRTCRAFRPLPSPVRAVDPIPTALLCAAHGLEPDMLVAVLDSLLRLPTGPLSIGDLREIFDGAPQRIQRLLGVLDPQAGSGTESVTRYRLHCAHIKVQSQVDIPNVGRVDLLVGEALIIECDSDGFHNGDQRRTDNRRDRKSTIGGYACLRIDYQEVMFAWDGVFADILAMVRGGRHRN